MTKELKSNIIEMVSKYAKNKDSLEAETRLNVVHYENEIERLQDEIEQLEERFLIDLDEKVKGQIQANQTKIKEAQEEIKYNQNRIEKYRTSKLNLTEQELETLQKEVQAFVKPVTTKIKVMEKTIDEKLAELEKMEQELIQVAGEIDEYYSLFSRSVSDNIARQYMESNKYLHIGDLVGKSNELKMKAQNLARFI